MHHNTLQFFFLLNTIENSNIKFQAFLKYFLKKESDIGALRKCCFEIFGKMIQPMLQWNPFQILEFLAAVIVFVFLLIFDFEKKTATDAISKAVLKILQNSKENIYDGVNLW